MCGVARRAVNHFSAFKMELQNWVGSLHDNMMKVVNVAEPKESRLMELDVRSARISQATVELGAHYMHRKRSEELRPQP